MMNNKRGSTLLIVIILFAVISILGITMLGIALQSQNETFVYMDEQKAYYMAKSAVDATVSFFTNPEKAETSLKPQDVIGKKATGEKIDEKTGEKSTFKIVISKEGDQVLIEGTGYHKDKSRTIKATLTEQIKTSGGVLGQGLAFAVGQIQGMDMKMEGDVYIDSTTLNQPWGNVTLKNLEYKGNLYLKSHVGVAIQDSFIDNAYLKLTGGTVNMEHNKRINNAYVLTDQNVKVTSFQHNTVNDTAYIQSHTDVNPQIYHNIVKGRMMFDFNSDQLSLMNSNTIEKLYIKGVKTLNNVITGKADDEVKTLYTDTPLSKIYLMGGYGDYMTAVNAEKKPEQLPNTFNQEVEYIKQSVESKLKEYEVFSSILRGEVEDWLEPIDKEPEPIIDPYNIIFKEYYYPEEKIRLVYMQKPGQYLNVYIGNKPHTAYSYYISPQNTDTIIFINNYEHGGIDFRMSLNGVKTPYVLNNIYVYNPKAKCQFFETENLSSFNGAIITRWFIRDEKKNTVAFNYKEPPSLQRFGEPQVDGGLGGSNTSITYIKNNPLYIK